MNDMIHVLTSVVVKLRESAVKDQRYNLQGWKVRVVVKLAIGGCGRRCCGRKNVKIHETSMHFLKFKYLL